MPGARGGVACLCVTFAQNKLLCVVVSPTAGGLVQDTKGRWERAAASSNQQQRTKQRRSTRNARHRKESPRLLL
ncbi:MAG: hypothetical protein ACPIOQ_55030, partial [Promethearchaeia archaeon]